MNGINNEFVGNTGTHKCNNFKVFSASEHVGSISLAKSIAFRSFSPNIIVLESAQDFRYGHGRNIHIVEKTQSFLVLIL